MRIILEKYVDNKKAQLVLCDDNTTVQVIYDGKCIDSSAGGTWNNLRGSGLEDVYLTFALEDIKESSEQIDYIFEEMRRELD